FIDQEFSYNVSLFAFEPPPGMLKILWENTLDSLKPVNLVQDAIGVKAVSVIRKDGKEMVRLNLINNTEDTICVDAHPFSAYHFNLTYPGEKMHAIELLREEYTWQDFMFRIEPGRSIEIYLPENK